MFQNGKLWPLSPCQIPGSRVPSQSDRQRAAGRPARLKSRRSVSVCRRGCRRESGSSSGAGWVPWYASHRTFSIGSRPAPLPHAPATAHLDARRRRGGLKARPRSPDPLGEWYAGAPLLLGLVRRSHSGGCPGQQTEGPRCRAGRGGGGGGGRGRLTSELQSAASSHRSSQGPRCASASASAASAA